MISRNGLAYLWAGTPPMREWRAKREEAEKRATERPSSKSIRDAEGASGRPTLRRPARSADRKALRTSAAALASDCRPRTRSWRFHFLLAAVMLGKDLRELCPEQKNLRRIINPQQQDDQCPCGSEARSDCTTSNVPANK
jgi:hypothetical protein